MKRVVERLGEESIRRHRILLLAAAVLVPLFWGVYQVLTPTEWDPLPLRLAIGALATVVLGASFVSRRVRRDLIHWSFAAAQVLIQWIIALAAINDFSVARVLGIVLVQYCAAALFTSVRHNIAMHVLTALGVGLAIPFANAGLANGIMTFSVVVTAAMFSVAWAMSYERTVMALIDSEDQLRDARDTLEDRVRERTEDLQREVAYRAAAEARASQASQAKSYFLTNMSHELRTPLNAVIGYAELIHEDLGPDPHPAKADLSHILDAASHLLAMINGILDLAKVESGEWEYVYEEAVVGDLVDHVATTVAPMVAERDNQLHIEVEADLPHLLTDRTRLVQILVNLVHNAAKFTDHGHITVRAQRTRRGSVQGLIVDVQDTGPGIPPEHLDRVFDKFVQLDGPRLPHRKGTGLGLAIGREMARGMGGDLSVVSQVGEGSTFSLWVPWRSDRATPAQAALAG